MMAPDVVEPTAFLRRLAIAYERAAERPTCRRLWTTEHPPGWVDTSTVAARRALTDFDRSRWLRYRAA